MTSTVRVPPTEATEVFRLLGGNKILGTRPQTEHDYILMVRKGLPYDALRSATISLALPFKTLAASLQLNTRTLLRRKHGRLSPVESEKIIRLARVAARAEVVLGSRRAALHWLASPNRALEGDRPLELLDTAIGTDEVLQVLGRLYESVYT